jgi:phage tail sheath protein FI
MTQADITLGRLIFEIGIAPIRRGEFFVVRFMLSSGMA